MVKKLAVLFFMFMFVLVSTPLENAYALIYTVTGSVVGGHGTITPLTQKVKPNLRCTITIKPDVGYHLATITDNGQTMKLSSPYAIPFVNENHIITFTFVINTYTVSASVSGGHGKAGPPSQTVTHGEKATLSIIPDEGYKITGIMDNGNSISIANPLVLNNVTLSHSLVIAFVSYTVNTSVAGSHGTLTPITMTVQSGGKATITIKPDIGYQIDKILDNDKVVPTANPYIITGITSNRKVVVSFTAAVLTIKASVAGGHGSITPSETKVLYGEKCRLSISPELGYHITGITDNGSPIPIKDILYLTDITINHSIVVSFIEFNLYTRMIEDHGVILPERQTMFYAGKATISIKPDPGYKVSYLIDNGSYKSPTTPTTYVINSVTEDHLIDVYFVSIYFTVNVSVAGGNGSATPLTQKVRYGSQTTLLFTPSQGYKLTGIIDNGKIKMAYSPYVIQSVTEDHSVIVSFQSYIVYASVSGGHGSVTPGAQSYVAGAKASLIMIPEAGYHIDQILDNDKVMPPKSPYVIPSVLENHTIQVKYAINTYTVTASVVGGHGKVSPATQTLNYSQKTTLTITPDTGYKIESITDNGVLVPIENPYPIFYISTNRNVTVKFSLKK